MATHQDLLDAIARIRTVTGDPQGWTAGLSGEDIAVAINPMSTPTALGAVMAKLIAAHPDSFLADPPSAPPSPPTPTPAPAQGAAAEAIGDAENALSQQKTAAAQLDLQVLTAVLNAHATHADGVAALDRLQREIEDAAAARTDLDTPAGARAFQRYLVDKLNDIRAVVETAGLDATSQAALAAALANLYAASTPEPVAEQGNQATTPAATPRTGAEEDAGDTRDDQDGKDGKVARDGMSSGDGENAGPARASEPAAPLGWAADPLSEFGEDLGAPLLSDPVAQAMPVPSAPVAAPAPGWGSGFPAAAPFGGGTSAPPTPALPTFAPDLPIDLTDGPRREPGASTDGDPSPEPDPEQDEISDETSPDEQGDAPPDEAAVVVLPGGETVTAPSPELAAVITAAVAGTPIPEAFRQQDITIPAPGTVVTGPLDAAQVVPGDIGLLSDRHALALGNGKALLDQQIQPIASVTGPGFLGWQHPPLPQPEPLPTPPETPAPIPSAETAPS